MESLSVVQQQNRELAKRINEEARRDPQSPYAGKVVGLADGQVVVVGEDFDTVIKQLVQICPDPQRTFWIDASLDYEAPVMIWSMH